LLREAVLLADNTRLIRAAAHLLGTHLANKKQPSSMWTTEVASQYRRRCVLCLPAVLLAVSPAVLPDARGE